MLLASEGHRLRLILASEMGSSFKQTLATWALTGAVGVLLSTNTFFIVRLIDKVDSTQELVWQLRQQLMLLSFRVDELAKLSLKEK
jgi:hypothetical protein